MVLWAENNTSWRSCLHDSSHAGKPVLLFSAYVGFQECACTEAYYYYPCPAARWSLWQRTQGWVGRGTRVLNNLYVEHVCRWGTLTHIWSGARPEPKAAWGERDCRRERKRLKCFLPGSPLSSFNDLVWSSLVTPDNLLLFFYHEGDKCSHSGFYTVPQFPHLNLRSDSSALQTNYSEPTFHLTLPLTLL